MSKTKKKTAVKKKKALKKRAPAKAKAKVKAKPKAKAKAKASAKAKPAAKKTKSKSKGLTFTELFEMKQKKMADEAQQPGWKESAAPAESLHSEQPKAPANVRNGRTNGSGARHH